MAAYGCALAFIAVAVGIRWALGSFVAGVVPFATLFPAIIVAALLGGTGPGVAAVVTGGFAAWYFFLTPTPEFGMPTASGGAEPAALRDLRVTHPGGRRR